MKKNLFIAALAALTLSLTACQKDDNNIVGNGDVNTDARVKSTSDLHNTDWTYSVTATELLASLFGADLSDVENVAGETYTFGLNFDGQYAHFSFPENVMAFGGDEGELNQITGVSYEYEYDGATHTGYLTVAAEDVDGDVTTAPLQFTYDDATDVITFNLNLLFAEDGTPLTLTLNFSRN